jgi:hypothetical protein
MSTEYWIITLHPPRSPQIPVGVLALLSGSDTLEIYFRSDLDHVASGDDLLVLQEFPIVLAEEAAAVGARRALQRWTEMLSHSVRIDGPFESDASSASVIWSQKEERLGQ